MGGGERLMKVNVQDIDAEITGPCDSQHRVQIRSIHVNERSMRMEKLRNLGDLIFKNPKRVGIRDHDCRDVLINDVS